MTFFEAAVAVLRAAGRPLHFKKITEIAIRRDLLSHVGKTPDFTMGARLNQEIRKDDGRSVVVRTRPGVFGLRTWESGLPLELQDIRETVRLYATAQEEAAAVNELLVLDEDDDLDEEGGLIEASVPGEAVEEGRRRRRRLRRQGEGEGEGAPAAEPPAEIAAPEVAAVSVEAAAPAAPATSAAAPVRALTLVEGAAWLLRERFDDPDGVAELRLAEALVEEGVRGEPEEVAGQLRLVMLADNAARLREQRPPRFEHNGRGSWRRAQWSLPEASRSSLERLEGEAAALAAATHRALDQWLGQLPAEGLVTLAEVMMQRLGCASWEVLYRGDAGVVIRYSGAALAPGARALALALGALPSLPSLPAERWAAVLVEEGRGAAEAAAQEAGYQLLGRSELVAWLVRLGVGVRLFQAPVVLEDTAFFLALGAPE